MNYLKYSKDWLSNLVFPMRCIECGRFNDDKFKGYICNKCLRLIKVNHSFECVGCKREVPYGKTCYFCKEANFVDQLLIAADYKDSNVSKILKFVKYKFISELINPLFSVVKEYIKWLNAKKHLNIFDERPIVLPIPLYRTRYNWRGFNQSEILARLIADNFQSEFSSTVLERSKGSTPQAEIENREDRIKNMEHLFQVSNSGTISGRTILLVDDVCTTGATLNEAARVLKENGARKVVGLVVARG